MSIAVNLLALAVGCYAVAVLESWAVHGRLSLTRPAISALALLGREQILPRTSDRLFFESGPVLLLVAGLLSVAVIPLAPGLIITDLAIGALFLNAALAYVLVALIMAGWGPNGAYGMIGGWRFLGQFIAYAMLIVMPITAVAMRAESLSTTQIVLSQAALWNVAYQPIGFVLFVIAAMGVAWLPPIDLPIGGGDLAGGVEAEYTGARLAVLRLARLVIIVALASATVTFYLGGWLGPWLPGWAWTALKTLAVAAGMLALGPRLPRLREAKYLAVSWKLGITLALANIFLVGVIALVVPI
ncbi:complex I subunit 1/NuoH family protein [Sulfitobacter pontiacus]|jgi:NADH-quinone oxidoreductase subunit H|uniref:complex I subunit 1/NuoH family protein n=1 Tax=Sulfitobacter pontiacus TaxID=60137 RepID=UPI0030EEFF67|tara:strand:- start:22425 stop:23324 length:900 start_codon:yes stop_codon:yes gene_type:complete